MRSSKKTGYEDVDKLLALLEADLITKDRAQEIAETLLFNGDLTQTPAPGKHKSTWTKKTKEPVFGSLAALSQEMGLHLDTVEAALIRARVFKGSTPYGYGRHPRKRRNLSSIGKEIAVQDHPTLPIKWNIDASIRLLKRHGTHPLDY